MSGVLTVTGQTYLTANSKVSDKVAEIKANIAAMTNAKVALAA